MSSAPPAHSPLDRLTLIAGILLLLLVVGTVVVAGRNRALQEKVNAGQARLANAQTEANLDNTLIRLLTKAAAEHNDEPIKALLAANGITYSQAPPAAAAPEAKP